MQGRKQYQEKLFTVFRLSDRVPADNFYRRLKEVLNLNFLYTATRKYYGKEGNPGIDPVVFFKLLLTGYFENLQSDRRIIENAKMRMDILYFIGYDIDEEMPWHSTLSRTRQLYGEEVFLALFQEVLKLCVDKGMVAGKRQAIDSVLVKANASVESIVDKDILNDGIQYIASIKREDEQEENVKKMTSDNEKKTNENRYSPTDPDARIAIKPGKPRQMYYLGQTSVDTAHHVITNIEAHHADKRDSECFKDVLTNTVKNLSAHGIKVEEVIADTNYSSATALKAAEEKNIMAFIPNMGTYKEQREGFVYIKEGDYYQCSQGNKLPFKATRAIRNGAQQMKDYAASSKDCKVCPLKIACIPNQRYKTLSHTIDKDLYDKMNKRMKSPYAYKMKKLRQSTVEPVIGTLSIYLGMKRVHSKGIIQANKVMLSAAIAYNLKKWLKWIVKTPTIAIALSRHEEKVKNINHGWLFPQVFHYYSPEHLILI